MSSELVSMIDGMSQNERLIPALDPAHVPLEDRDLPDLLSYVAEISAQLTFYDQSNQPAGNWASFIRSDINILIALIARFDLAGAINEFFKLESHLDKAAGDPAVLEALRQIFQFIFEMNAMLIGLYESLASAKNTDGFPISPDVFQRPFTDEIGKLRRYNLEAYDNFDTWFIIDSQFERFNTNYKKNWHRIFDDGASVKEKSVNAFGALKELFEMLRSRFNELYSASIFYIRHNDLSSKKYPPHVAMLITFLNLFGSLKQPLNGLVKKHLDFYYQQRLGLFPAKAIGDKVHVVFEPAPNAENILLERGTELTGEAADKARVSYLLDDDLLITQTVIRQLKTIYVAEHTQYSSGNRRTKTGANASNTRIPELHVYKSSNERLPKWPVLGEDQALLRDDVNTMQDAEIGFLLSSPVLYQPSGYRIITAKIELDEQAFRDISAYMLNYERRSRTTGASYKLLANAFLIYLSGPSGWDLAAKFKVFLNDKKKRIDISIFLESSQPPVVVCNEAIHGQIYNVKWPALKIMVNNNAGHNPLTFLPKALITRVTVHAAVKDNRDLSIQNNNGPLSTANPFQPFGPLAPAGSYMELRNTNIFNKYLSSASLKLEWEGLPDLPGGWDLYYDAYHQAITNSSFRVKIAAVRDRINADNAEEMPLFETVFDNDGNEVLKNTTLFEDIDVKKWALGNTPLFDAEAGNSFSANREGTVRIELTAPSVGFGSSIFSPLFSEVAVHNSKWYRSKKPLPLPPYIPVLRSVTVDYTMQHTEDLLSAAADDIAGAELRFIHLHPFGYEEIYPRNKGREHFLLPQYEKGQNLFIGLEGLTAHAELSILFQMEEASFAGNSEDFQKLNWFYLHRNNWLPLEILYDSTDSFIQSGIVKLAISSNHQKNDNTVFPGTLQWIRACRSLSDIYSPDVTGIFLHAGSATRVPDQNMETSLIGPGILQSFRKPIKEIQAIRQPFSSFGGKPAETLTGYYTRVSERLRHRQRLLNPIDIEQAILENYPQIQMAKCIRSTATDLDFKDGYRLPDIRVILIPARKHALSDKPKVSSAVLRDVKAFLESSLSPFVTVSVQNPVYETVKVVARVRFIKKRAADTGLYKKKLDDDIKQYLCPWLFSSDYDFNIGSRLLITDLLNFIKKRDYIKEVDSFSVVHFFKYYDDENNRLAHGVRDYAGSRLSHVEGYFPGSVFFPSSNHAIDVVDGGDTAGTDESKMLYKPASRIGIGHLAIGDELLVQDQEITNAFSTEMNNFKKPAKRFNWVINRQSIN